MCKVAKGCRLDQRKKLWTQTFQGCQWTDGTATGGKEDASFLSFLSVMVEWHLSGRLFSPSFRFSIGLEGWSPLPSQSGRFSQSGYFWSGCSPSRGGEQVPGAGHAARTTPQASNVAGQATTTNFLKSGAGVNSYREETLNVLDELLASTGKEYLIPCVGGGLEETPKRSRGAARKGKERTRHLAVRTSTLYPLTCYWHLPQ
ncbi:hypothetical protein CPAR01_13775 [Colletotrichum paranaense]|uniref:Uncharacterized protein n=1 Tax=Colletotrichum paranaense TaxID=1914294 RepID=A0ABQ9S4D9_9PEZI|nr:uncharacterized protein CPAR01_13775 [Colletotrichum paranaense]KAK1524827.1 hypothetical protein CPAR01_13775 [Colletotrichum paranaense]